MKLLFLPPAALLALLSPPLPASEAPAVPLREIVVTAQKREQSLARVPASVLVADAARLEVGNLNRLDELAEFLPGLAVSDTGVGTQLFIRGMGSGSNPAFEQSGGQYLDGIHYGRAPLSSLPFLDLARVELLRGPQSILFGKNAVAGALNLVSARPTPERFVRLRGLYELSARQREQEAVLSGPLRSWDARLAWRRMREDGFLRNTHLHRDEPSRREDALRLSLARRFGSRLSVLLKLEDGRHGSAGAAREIVRDDPGFAGALPPAGLPLAQGFAALGLPALESLRDHRRQAEGDAVVTRVRNLSAELVRAGAAHRLTLLGGLLSYDANQACDCDFSPAPFLETRLHENYRQFSQELRLESLAPGPLEWTAGAHLQAGELAAADTLLIPADSPFPALAAAVRAPLHLLPGSAAARQNQQDSRAFSLFLQGAWTFASGWRLTLGGRQTWERKAATRALSLQDEAGRPRDDPPLALVYRDVLGIHSRQLRALDPAQDHLLQGVRREAQFAPLLRLEREGERGTFYLGAVSGYKGGGFDARANSPRSFEFAEEGAHSLEAGVRSLLRGGALEINAAVFTTRYRDLQISQFDGALGFNVGNAPEAESRGVELDGRWALGRGWRLGYAWSWLESAYTDFPNGNCPNGRVPDGAVVGGVALCDYRGETGKYAPRQRLSLILDHRRPLGAGAQLDLSASLNYRGPQHVHDNLDPLLRAGSALRLNLRLALERGAWRLALIGRNLGATYELTHAGNVPLSAALFGSNTFHATVARPRQVALELTWRFDAAR